MPKILDSKRLAEACARVAAGESQQRVARETGISQSAISRHIRAYRSEAVR